METIENLQSLTYNEIRQSNLGIPQYDMPPCCMTTVEIKCSWPMTHSSKYCVQHTFGQYYAQGNGCKFGLVDHGSWWLEQAKDLKQCGKPVFAKGRMYCITHYMAESRIENVGTCTHLLKHGERHGQLCGANAILDEPQLCKTHLRTRVRFMLDEIASNEEKELRDKFINLFDKLIAPKRAELKAQVQETTNSIVEEAINEAVFQMEQID